MEQTPEVEINDALQMAVSQAGTKVTVQLSPAAAREIAEALLTFAGGIPRLRYTPDLLPRSQAFGGPESEAALTSPYSL